MSQSIAIFCCLGGRQPYWSPRDWREHLIWLPSVHTPVEADDLGNVLFRLRVSETNPHRAWMARLGLTSPATVKVGMGGFRGANLSEISTLGRFLSSMKSGEVPSGSYLLVESLDRLSRQNVFTSLWVFTHLIKADVKPVKRPLLRGSARPRRFSASTLTDRSRTIIPVRWLLCRRRPTRRLHRPQDDRTGGLGRSDIPCPRAVCAGPRSRRPPL